MCSVQIKMGFLVLRRCFILTKPHVISQLWVPEDDKMVWAPVVCGHASFASKALMSSYAANPCECHRWPAGVPTDPRASTTVSPARVRKRDIRLPKRVARKDPSAEKGGGEARQGKQRPNHEGTAGLAPMEEGTWGTGEKGRLWKQTGRRTSRAEALSKGRFHFQN